MVTTQRVLHTQRCSRRAFVRGVAGLIGLAALVPLSTACAPTPPVAAPTGAPAKSAPQPTTPSAAAPAATTAPAVTAAPATAAPKTPALSGLTAWIEAGKQFKGKTVTGMTSAGDWGKAHGKLWEEYARETGINIQIEHVPEGESYLQKLQSVLVGRSGSFDFVAIPYQFLGLYSRAGALQVLDSYLTDSRFPDYDIADYPQNIIDVYTRRDGKTIAMPAGCASQIAFYRKDLLAEAGLKPPTTWPEVYEAAKKLRKGDVWGAAWDLKGNSAVYRVANILPKDLPWVTPDMRLSIYRDPRTIEVMEIWQRMYKEDLIPKDTVANDLVATYAIYQSGKAALLPLAWPAAIPTMEDPAKSEVAGKTTYAQVPGGAPWAGGWSYAIPVDAKEKDVAYLVVAYQGSKEGSVKQLLEYGNLNASYRKSTLTPEVREALLKGPYGAALLEGLDATITSWANARFTPLFPEWGQVATQILPISQKILVGELSAKDGMNMMADEGERVLRELGLLKG